MSQSSSADIPHGPHAFLIDDYRIPLRRDDFLGLKDPFYKLPRVILRMVVEDYHMEVLILLLYDGSDIPEAPLSKGVIEGRHHQAEGELRVFADSIPRFVIILL